MNALRAFESAARHLSFKAAAGELCVTQGAVSRHVLRLEQFLGTRLFHRLHRQVELTRDGAAYLRETREAFLRIAQATAAIGAGAQDRTLRIMVPPTCAMRWLVPRLGRFHASHPEIAVEVSASHQPVNFARDEVDAAIDYGPRIGRKLAGERLFGEVLVPVCARKLLPRTRRPREPRELARYALLHSIRRTADWPQWFAAAGMSGFSAERMLTFENSAMTYQGAMDGLGIALAQLAFVADELATGRLVEPLNIRVSNPLAYHLVFPRDSARQPKIRAFRQWIAAEAAATRRVDPAL